MSKFRGFSESARRFLAAHEVIRKCQQEVSAGIAEMLPCVAERVAHHAPWYDHNWHWELYTQSILWVYRKEWRPYGIHLEVEMSPEWVSEGLCRISVDIEGEEIPLETAFSSFCDHERDEMVRLGYLEDEGDTHIYQKMARLDFTGDPDTLVREIAAEVGQLGSVAYMVDRLLPPGRSAVYRSDTGLREDALIWEDSPGGQSIEDEGGRTGGRCLRVTNTAEHFNHEARKSNLLTIWDVPPIEKGYMVFWVRSDSQVDFELETGGQDQKGEGWVPDLVVEPGHVTMAPSGPIWVRQEVKLTRNEQREPQPERTVVHIFTRNGSGNTWIDGIEIGSLP